MSCKEHKLIKGQLVRGAKAKQLLGAHCHPVAAVSITVAWVTKAEALKVATAAPTGNLHIPKAGELAQEHT